MFFLAPFLGPHFLTFWSFLVPKCWSLGPQWRSANAKMAPKIAQVAPKWSPILKDALALWPTWNRLVSKFSFGVLLGTILAEFGWIFDEIWWILASFWLTRQCISMDCVIIFDRVWYSFASTFGDIQVVAHKCRENEKTIIRKKNAKNTITNATKI